MLEKIFIHLLILCGIWVQGITGTLADEEIKESSDLLVRQKRVISHLPGEDTPVRISDAPYSVHIAEFGRTKCTGSILSSNVVITSASCVSNDPEFYRVFSGTSRLSEGEIKNVTQIRRRRENINHRTLDGVALAIVIPYFTYSASCQPIRLHAELVLQGTIGRVHGWGYYSRSENHGTNNYNYRGLRSIEVPIISHLDCVNRYEPHLEISAKNICTYHPQRHSGHIDFGAGLVVNGKLAGVFLWSGITGQIDPNYPDVFAFLQDSYYNQWITTNVRNVSSHFLNLHYH